MAQQTIALGAAPNDDNGDDLRAGGAKINDNFDEIYEQANWTPVLEGASVAGSHTYAVQTGRYRKVGPLCFAWFGITLTAKDAAMSGNIQVTGLPFPVSGSGFYFAFIPNFFNLLNFTAGYAQLSGSASVGETKFTLRENGDNVNALSVDEAAIGSTFSFGGVCIFSVA